MAVPFSLFAEIHELIPEMLKVKNKIHQFLHNGTRNIFIFIKSQKKFKNQRPLGDLQDGLICFKGDIVFLHAFSKDDTEFDLFAICNPFIRYVQRTHRSECLVRSRVVLYLPFVFP